MGGSQRTGLERTGLDGSAALSAPPECEERVELVQRQAPEGQATSVDSSTMHAHCRGRFIFALSAGNLRDADHAKSLPRDWLATHAQVPVSFVRGAAASETLRPRATLLRGAPAAPRVAARRDAESSRCAKRAVVIAVPGMGVVQMSLDEVVHVIPVRDLTVGPFFAGWAHPRQRPSGPSILSRWGDGPARRQRARGRRSAARTRDRKRAHGG